MFSKDCKFELTENQYKKIEEWNNTHECTLRPKYGMEKYCGPIGGALSLTFIPTSIGMFVKVRCVCGQKIDVSEDI